MLLSYGGLICAFLNQNNKSPSTLLPLARPFHLWLPGSWAESDRRAVMMAWWEDASCSLQQVRPFDFNGNPFFAVDHVFFLLGDPHTQSLKDLKCGWWWEACRVLVVLTNRQRRSSLNCSWGRIWIYQIPQLLGEEKPNVKADPFQTYSSAWQFWHNKDILWPFTVN